MSTHHDWNALAHRALATASLYGLATRTRGPSVVCAPPGELTRAGNADVIVTVDARELDAGSFAAARDATPGDGIVAVVVGSTSALGLLESGGSPEPGRADAFARAARWATFARHAPRAPAVSPARLREIAAAASNAGLALVEPEVAHARPQPKQAVDRAVLATITLGATAKALLFLRERAAPKGGLARVRDERILDGWIAGRGLRRTSPSPSLIDAALATLADTPAPMRGKDLLREARARWTEAARAAGARATTSSADAAALAKELRLLWLDGAIELYATDPAVPLA